MGNKRSKQRKPKQSQKANVGAKGGSMSVEEMGSPSPARKNRKK